MVPPRDISFEHSKEVSRAWIKRAKTKSFEVAPVDNINKDLELVNQHTVKPLTTDEVYMFKVVLVIMI